MNMTIVEKFSIDFPEIKFGNKGIRINNERANTFLKYEIDDKTIYVLGWGEIKNGSFKSWRPYKIKKKKKSMSY